MTKALRSSFVAFVSFTVRCLWASAGSAVRTLSTFPEGSGGITAPRGRGEGRLLWAFLVATGVQAGAHGAMAASAGLLGQALVGRQLGASVVIVDSLPGLFSPLSLCLFGFVAALVKAGAGGA